MSEPNFPLLSVAAFLDRTTVALTGTRLDEFSEGETLYILGVGTTVIPGAELPLVVPKGELDVEANAGGYLLAKSPVVEKQVTVPGLFSASDFFRDQVKTVVKRDPIVDKGEFIGNPGNKPVAAGDVVIRKSDLAAYVKWYGESRR